MYPTVSLYLVAYIVFLDHGLDYLVYVKRRANVWSWGIIIEELNAPSSYDSMFSFPLTSLCTSYL